MKVFYFLRSFAVCHQTSTAFSAYGKVPVMLRNSVFHRAYIIDILFFFYLKEDLRRGAL
jgi:hypothetical protein